MSSIQAVKTTVWLENQTYWFELVESDIKAASKEQLTDLSSLRVTSRRRVKNNLLISARWEWHQGGEYRRVWQVSAASPSPCDSPPCSSRTSPGDSGHVESGMSPARSLTTLFTKQLHTLGVYLFITIIHLFISFCLPQCLDNVLIMS